MAILPLSLEGVGYRAGGRQLLDNISLQIDAGPPTVILGRNGAGKSLLLRICHGLLPFREGSTRWCGADAAGARHRQAMVFQKPVMLRRSVRANIAYALRLRGIASDERERRIAQVLAQTGLAALAGVSARVISGGEQQRLALARAWALAPEVLFLDEPTANLDPEAVEAVEAIIADMHAGGCKVVMTTHDIGQARRLGGEIVFLDRGRVVERSPAATFFSAPRSEAAAAFLSGRLRIGADD